jgi:hypothetical protein
VDHDQRPFSARGQSINAVAEVNRLVARAGFWFSERLIEQLREQEYEH